MSQEQQITQMEIELEKKIDDSKQQTKSKKSYKPKNPRKFSSSPKKNQIQKKPLLEPKFEITPKLYVIPNRTQFIPIDPQSAIIYNHPLEFKSVGGLCLELLSHFISKYSTPFNDQSSANVITEFRHHLATAVIAYLQAASFTTIFPPDIATKLNAYSNKSLFIDPDLVKVFNAFMPVKDAVQANIVDVCFKANVIFDQLQPLYDSIVCGQPLKDQTSIQYNNIMIFADHNPIIQAIQAAHTSPAFATYMTASELQSSVFSRVGSQYKFETVKEVKIPTFIFDFDPTRSRYSTRKQYSIVVRSKEFVTINNSNFHGVSSFHKLPTRESDTIVRVNSTYQYIQGFHIWESSHSGFESIRYQNRDVVQVTPPQTQVISTGYQGASPKPNYEVQVPKVDTKIHSCQIVFYSERDHGKNSDCWFKLAIPTDLLNKYVASGKVHLSTSNAIQTIDQSLDLTQVGAVTAIERYTSNPFGVTLDDVNTLRNAWAATHQA